MKTSSATDQEHTAAHLWRPESQIESIQHLPKSSQHYLRFFTDPTWLADDLISFIKLACASKSIKSSPLDHPENDIFYFAPIMPVLGVLVGKLYTALKSTGSLDAEIAHHEFYKHRQNLAEINQLKTMPQRGRKKNIFTDVDNLETSPTWEQVLIFFKKQQAHPISLNDVVWTVDSQSKLKNYNNNLCHLLTGVSITSASFFNMNTTENKKLVHYGKNIGEFAHQILWRVATMLLLMGDEHLQRTWNAALHKKCHARPHSTKLKSIGEKPLTQSEYVCKSLIFLTQINEMQEPLGESIKHRLMRDNLTLEIVKKNHLLLMNQLVSLVGNLNSDFYFGRKSQKKPPNDTPNINFFRPSTIHDWQSLLMGGYLLQSTIFIKTGFDSGDTNSHPIKSFHPHNGKYLASLLENPAWQSEINAEKWLELAQNSWREALDGQTHHDFIQSIKQDLNLWQTTAINNFQLNSVKKMCIIFNSILQLEKVFADFYMEAEIYQSEPAQRVTYKKTHSENLLIIFNPEVMFYAVKMADNTYSQLTNTPDRVKMYLHDDILGHLANYGDNIQLQWEPSKTPYVDSEFNIILGIVAPLHIWNVLWKPICQTNPLIAEKFIGFVENHSNSEHPHRSHVVPALNSMKNHYLRLTTHKNLASPAASRTTTRI